jgi:alkylation response protein AidB-like acyl-CoA dehydrogenase
VLSEIGGMGFEFAPIAESRYGAARIRCDFGLAYQYARARVMRIVDGPDEAHRNQVAKLELSAYRAPRAVG